MLPNSVAIPDNAITEFWLCLRTLVHVFYFPFLCSSRCSCEPNFSGCSNGFCLRALCITVLFMCSSDTLASLCLLHQLMSFYPFNDVMFFLICLRVNMCICSCLIIYLHTYLIQRRTLSFEKCTCKLLNIHVIML